MNERIKELWLQSWVKITPDDPLSHERLDAEKFAELIVRECADISDASWHKGSAGYTAILKHFGVEE
jgi:hypothetical protein